MSDDVTILAFSPNASRQGGRLMCAPSQLGSPVIDRLREIIAGQERAGSAQSLAGPVRRIEGDTLIAGRPVTQLSPKGERREGYAWLVATAGGSTLHRNSKAALEQLEAWLPKVEGLVSGDDASREILVGRPELEAWRGELAALIGGRPDGPAPSAVKGPRPRTILRFVVPAILLTGLGAGLALWLGGRPPATRVDVSTLSKRIATECPDVAGVQLDGELELLRQPELGQISVLVGKGLLPSMRQGLADSDSNALFAFIDRSGDPATLKRACERRADMRKLAQALASLRQKIERADPSSKLKKGLESILVAKGARPELGLPTLPILGVNDARLIAFLRDELGPAAFTALAPEAPALLKLLSSPLTREHLEYLERKPRGLLNQPDEETAALQILGLLKGALE